MYFWLDRTPLYPSVMRIVIPLTRDRVARLDYDPRYHSWSRPIVGARDDRDLLQKSVFDARTVAARLFLPYTDSGDVDLEWSVHHLTCGLVRPLGGVTGVLTHVSSLVAYLIAATCSIRTLGSFEWKGEGPPPLCHKRGKLRRYVQLKESFVPAFPFSSPVCSAASARRVKNRNRDTESPFGDEATSKMSDTGVYCGQWHCPFRGSVDAAPHADDNSFTGMSAACKTCREHQLKMSNPCVSGRAAPEHPFGFAAFVPMGKLVSVAATPERTSEFCARLRVAPYAAYAAIALIHAMNRLCPDNAVRVMASCHLSSLTSLSRAMMSNACLLPVLDSRCALILRPFDVGAASYLSLATSTPNKCPKAVQACMSTPEFVETGCTVAVGSANPVRSNNRRILRLAIGDKLDASRWGGSIAVTMQMPSRNLLITTTDLMDVLSGLFRRDLRITIMMGPVPPSTKGHSCKKGFPGFSRPVVTDDAVIIRAMPVLDAEYVDWGFIASVYREALGLLTRFSSDSVKDGLGRTGRVEMTLHLENVLAHSERHHMLPVKETLLALWKAATPAFSKTPEVSAAYLRRGKCMACLLHLASEADFDVRARLMASFTPALYKAQHARAEEVAECIKLNRPLPQDVTLKHAFPGVEDLGNAPFVHATLAARHVFHNAAGSFQQPLVVYKASGSRLQADPTGAKRRKKSSFPFLRKLSQAASSASQGV